MKRLLYVTPFCHIPPSDGASARGLNLLQQLRSEFDVTLLTYRKRDFKALADWAAAQRLSLLWLPAELPVQRDLSFLKRMFSTKLAGFAGHDGPAIAESIDLAWQDHGPYDVLYFATQLVGLARLYHHWPSRTVLDLYDIYTPVLRQRAAEIPIHRPYHWLLRVEALRMRYFERRLLSYFDDLLVVSEQDENGLLGLGVKKRPLLVPNGAVLPAPKAHIPPPPSRKIVLMVANFTYPPNARGFIWFFKEIWSYVHAQIPGAELYLVGSSDGKLQAVTNGDPSVTWYGRVPDLAIFYEQACCVVVPIQEGGGTRLKLLEAMAWGVPIISTSVGCAGVEHQDTVLLADDPSAFTRKLAAVLNNPVDFAEQAQRSRQVIADQYTWDRIGAELRNYLNSVGGGPARDSIPITGF